MRLFRAALLVAGAAIVSTLAVVSAGAATKEDSHRPEASQSALDQLQAAHPQVVAPSESADVDAEPVSPTLQPDGDELVADQTLSPGTIGTAPERGFSVGEGSSAVTFVPLAVSRDASAVTVVAEDAAFFSDTALDTDTVIRPTADGMESFLHLRSTSSPESFRWRVGLPKGHRLVKLDDARVAVVENASSDSAPSRPVIQTEGLDEAKAPRTSPSAGGEPPETDATPKEDPVPVPDDPAVVNDERSAALERAADPAAQLAASRRAATEATKASPQRVVAVIDAPAARDAAERDVPLQLDVNGDRLVLTVKHHERDYAYPVIADPNVTNLGADDGGRKQIATLTSGFDTMTWNVRSDPADFLPNLGSVASLIAKQRVPVVAVQEVCSRSLRDLFTALQQRHYRMDYFFAREFEANSSTLGHECHRGQGDQGVAIFARPAAHLSSYGQHPFNEKSSARDFNRTVVAGTVTLGQRAIRIYNTHLDHISVDVRTRQVRQLAGIAVNHYVDTPLKLVVGDFNALPGSPELGPMEPAFTDAGPLGRRVTTFPSSPDPQKIDYIWYGGAMKRRSSRVVTQMDTGSRKNPHGVSDHFPLRAQLGYIGGPRSRPPLPAPIINTVRPSITGDLRIGSVLSADPGEWSDVPDGFDYQWCVVATSGACEAITGATDGVYSVQPADAGRDLAVRVTPTGQDGSTAATSAALTVFSRITNTEAPTIDGVARVGSTLTASLGRWTGSPERYTIAWLRCVPSPTTCDAIPHTASATYSLTPADVGSTIQVEVMALGGTDSASARSTVTDPVKSDGAPSVVAPPTVYGAPREGWALSAGPGSWTNDPSSFSYRWLRCDASGDQCDPVATGETYDLDGVDVDHTLRIEVTASNEAGSTATTSSASPIVTTAVNLLPNNSFEELDSSGAPTHWHRTWTGFMNNSFDSVDGRYSMLGYFPQINDWLIYDSDWVPVAAGRPYTSSYYLRAESVRDTVFWTEQLYFDATGRQVGQYWSTERPVSTEWQRSIPLTVKAPQGAVWMLMRMTVPYAYSTPMHFDAAQLEESEHATTYRP